ncbi:cytochrome P450 [Aspergillus californicus]
MTLLAFIFPIYRGSTRIYRRYFHLLKGFCGSPEACVSGNDARALRIAPNELHISDVSLYKTIYNQTSLFRKDATFYDRFNAPHSVFGELDPILHKERCRMLNPLFSRAGVFKLEPIVHEKLDILLAKIDQLSSRMLIDTYNAFRLLTTEIIMQITLGRTLGVIEEDHDGFSSWCLGAVQTIFQRVIETQRWPWLRGLFKIIPLSLTRGLSPQIGIFLDIVKSSLRHSQTQTERPSHPVLCENLASIPDVQKVSAATNLLIAGADTTASTLTTAFYIFSATPCSSQMITAVDAAAPRGEDFPSLTACTIVSMSAHTMHYKTDLWGPDARTFNPDRWLGEKAKHLDKYFVTFFEGITRVFRAESLLDRFVVQFQNPGVQVQRVRRDLS